MGKWVLPGSASGRIVPRNFVSVSAISFEPFGTVFKGQLTIGLDLGDRFSSYCVLDENGEIILERKLPTTPEAMKRTFARMPRSRHRHGDRDAFSLGEPRVDGAGTRSDRGARRKVRLIVKTRRKDDRLDARRLARLARIDPQLLTPVQHRSAQAQLHLAGIGTGERSNGPGECRPRIGEVLRRTAAQVWHAASPSGDYRWIEPRTARSLGAAVARGGIAQRTHHGIRSAD